MCSLTELPTSAGRTASADHGSAPGRRRVPWLLPAVAVLGPVAVAVLLTPWRDRLAAALCALASALSFDFLLTRPYGSFRITRTSDLVTELLLLVVGLVVGDLAARGRIQRVAADRGRRHLALLHSVTELAAGGRDPAEVIDAAGRELCGLLDLRSCEFTPGEPPVAARVESDGEVRIGTMDWSTGDLGLPHRGVDLSVRGGGAVLGHFVLIPVPGVRVPRDHLAVAVADQVGAALVGSGARMPAWRTRPPGARARFIGCSHSGNVPETKLPYRGPTKRTRSCPVRSAGPPGPTECARSTTGGRDQGGQERSEG